MKRRAQWLVVVAVLVAATYATAALAHGWTTSTVTQLWGTRFVNHGSSTAHAIAYSPDGSKVFVTGLSTGHTETVAYDAATGHELWETFFHTHQVRPGAFTAIGVSPDGSKVYVTGTARYLTNGATGLDYITTALDAQTGQQRWFHRYDPDAHKDDVASALAVSSDGSKVFVTGYSTGATTGADYATVELDSSNGHRLWAKRYNGPASGDDRATAIAITPDGTKVYVTGESVGYAGTHDYATIAYDVGTGAQLWLQRIDGPAGGEDVPRAIAVNPDGTAVYVTGTVMNNSSGQPTQAFGTYAYIASNGALQWGSIYVGYLAHDGPDEARAIAVSPDGQHIFVTGPSSANQPAPATRDYTTIAYSVAGVSDWISRYDGPAKLDDVSNAVAVSPDGSKLFVTGGSQTSTANGEDYATIALDPANGSRLWVKRNNGQWSGDDEAVALAVSPDSGKVVVTGSSGNAAANGTDWSILAYSTG